MKKRFRLLKLIIISVISLYVIITLINQQKILNSYLDEKNDLIAQISEKEKYQEKLKISNENIDSQEYIEKVAREKLGMYKTNERVYVNIGN